MDITEKINLKPDKPLDESAERRDNRSILDDSTDSGQVCRNMKALPSKRSRVAGGIAGIHGKDIYRPFLNRLLKHF